MKYQDILRELKAGTYRPIYFLMGEEAYFIDEIVRFIEKRALPEDQQSFNQTILYGRDTDIQTVIGEAKRFQDDRATWYEAFTGEPLAGSLTEQNEKFDVVARRFRNYNDGRATIRQRLTDEPSD